MFSTIPSERVRTSALSWVVHLLWLRRPSPRQLPGLAKRLSTSAPAGVLASGSSSCSPPACLTHLARSFGAGDTVNGFPSGFWCGRQLHQPGPGPAGSLPLDTLPEPKNIQGLDEEVLSRITHRTQSITLFISGNHREQIHFFLIRSSLSPGVLGSPWLALHNLQFDWPTGTSWSVNFHTNCLCSAVTSSSGALAPAQEIPDLSQVPREYHDLGEVLYNQRAFPPSVRMTVPSISSPGPLYDLADFTTSPGGTGVDGGLYWGVPSVWPDPALLPSWGWILLRAS